MGQELETFGGPPVNLENYRLDRPICAVSHPHIQDLRYLVARKRDRINAHAFYADRRVPIPNPLVNVAECAVACERIRSAVSSRQRILLYGDYDCDGVTSITLMLDALDALGVQPNLIEWTIPDRMRDGYGLKWARLDRHISHCEDDHQPDLLIALDCGSNSYKEVAKLLDHDIDVIVIDHHQLNTRESLPKSERVIHLNPWLWWPEKHHRYCAAGMTYFLADALHQHGKSSWNRERAILLAGLATCADVVPLLGNNRRLLKYSLSLARDPEKLNLVPGLMELGQAEPAKGVFNEKVYSLVWGPILNAPGRMGSANDAVELLRAKDTAQAQQIATRCLRVNRWRQATDGAMLHNAMRQAEAQIKDNPARKILFVCHPNWHPGVVGIVAARVRDRFQRPAFVSTNYGGGVWKGSIRSNVGCDVGKVLQQAKLDGVILEGGGHEMAGGLTFLECDRVRLHRWLEDNCGLTSDMMIPHVEIAAPVSALHPEKWGPALKMISPFGKENECPAFLVEEADLEVVREVTVKIPGSPKRRLFGYVGLFRETSTGFLFFALWKDHQMADLLWEVHRWVDNPNLEPDTRVRLDCRFKLELEMHAFVREKDRRSAVGGRIKWSFNYVVRKCQRTEGRGKPTAIENSNSQEPPHLDLAEYQSQFSLA